MSQGINKIQSSV